MSRNCRSPPVPVVLAPARAKKSVFKPRLALAFVLFICWQSQFGNVASARNQHTKNLRLRAPNQVRNDIPSILPDFSESEYIGEMGGPINAKIGSEGGRKKKSCGASAIAARSIVGPSMKRSYFANTPEEVEEKIQEEKRKKRDLSAISKRNDLTDGPLPWTCLTKYAWEDMGADHYPRFVRTAECKSRVCFNGFFRCKPRRYNTKVLKRITAPEATSCEEDDVSLPESLALNWRFITVTINLCCDCTGRVPGTEV